MLTVLLYLWVVFGRESSLFLEALLVLLTRVLQRVLAVGYDCKLEQFYIFVLSRMFSPFFCSYSSTILQMRSRQAPRLSFQLSPTSTVITSFASIIYLLLQNYFRQGCFRISSIDGRFSGLKLRVFEIISQAYTVQLLIHSFLLWGLILVSNSSISLPKLVLSDCRSWMVGGPVQVITLSIWFKVECPGNIGLPEKSSPMRHPKLQTSAAVEYFFDPSSISGALYHRVAIQSVSIISDSASASPPSDRISPKSHTFALHSSLTSILEGLISRCISPAECRQ